jgi:exopolysaccharide production protein ExoZ
MSQVIRNGKEFLPPNVTDRISVKADLIKHSAAQLHYIQSLRFLAATAVVIYHTLGTGHHYVVDQESKFFSLFAYGDHGVDLFFVISGFIIYYSTHRTAMSSTSFMLRRIERIVPMYWFATLGIVALSILFPAAFKSTAWLGSLEVIKSMLFITFSGGKFPVIYVGWSLEFEMFFYLFVSLLLLRSEIIWDELIIIFSLFVSLHSLLSNVSNISNFLTNSIILEFAFGVIVAKIFVGRPLSKLSIFALILSLLLIAKDNYMDRAILFGIPSAVVVLIASYMSERTIIPPYVVNIFAKGGDASYSIYLLQGLFISGACKFIVKFMPMSLDMLIVVVTTFTVAGGYLAYRFIEKPMSNITRRFRTIPKAFSEDRENRSQL